MADVLEKSRSLPAEEAEEYLITMERLRRFHETREGIPMAKVREWMLARRKDPNAPCPKAEPLPLP